MIHLHITLATAGLLALIYLGLSAGVVWQRFGTKTTLGDGEGVAGKEALLVAVRAHGNFAEYVPLCLILLGGCELLGANHRWLELLAMALLVARVLHPFGLMRPAPNAPRFMGVVLTFFVLGAGAVTALALTL